VIVLREIAIILGAMGCVFLIIPLMWVFWYGSPISFMLPLVLLAVVVAYAGYHIKKLRSNKEYDLAQYFMLFLIIAIVFSFIILFEIFPYVTPKGLI
jgi:hypothetical protein